MKTYCVFAYKPNSDDYCRGCHMASYSSNFICEKHINRERFIQLLVEIASYEQECGEDGYEQCEIFESSDSENYRSLGDFMYSYSDNSEEIQPIRDEIYQIILEQKQAKELAKKQEEERQKENKRLADAAAKVKKEQDERALFEKLKVKYEG